MARDMFLLSQTYMPLQEEKASFIQPQHLFLRKCWIETIKVEWETVLISLKKYI